MKAAVRCETEGHLHGETDQYLRDEAADVNDTGATKGPPTVVDGPSRGDAD